MKNIVICILAFAVLLPAVILTGSADIIADNYKPPRLYMYNSGYKGEPDKAVLFKTHQELYSYYEANKEKYGFDNDRSYVKKYQIENFRDTVNNKYDDGWFKEHDLVIFVSTAGSGSYFYRLKSLQFKLAKVEIVLFSDAPGKAVNCAIAGWHTFIEINKRSTTLSAGVSVVNK